MRPKLPQTDVLTPQPALDKVGACLVGWKTNSPSPAQRSVRTGARKASSYQLLHSLYSHGENPNSYKFMANTTELLNAHCKSYAALSCKQNILFNKREPGCAELLKLFAQFDGLKTEDNRVNAYKKFKEWAPTAKCYTDLKTQGLTLQLHAKLEAELKQPDVGPKPRVRIPHPPALVNGVYTGHRGVGDNLEKLKALGGFDLWPDGKATLKRFQSAQDLTGIAGWLKEIGGETKNCATFADYCRKARNHARPTISTTVDKKCGGYDSEYVYEFKLNNVSQMLMPAALFGPDWRDKFQLVMYLESGKNVSNSSIVGINLNLPTNEVVFLTKIPFERVTLIKSPKS